MKVLITGANGYIGKSLSCALKNKYNITSITREDCDLSNSYLVNSYFSNKWFDAVLHCAAIGGSRLKNDSWDVFDTNLRIYYNLLSNKNHFNKFINFGSGAELYFNNKPYGHSKDCIRKSIALKEDFYNLRIFACFDQNELNTRFIKHSISSYINKNPIQVYKNKEMDFLFMQDLISIVDFYLKEANPPKEINCVYQKKYSLLQISNIINELNNYKVPIICEEFSDEDYIGEYNFPFSNIGLEKGIKFVYDKLYNLN